jgi:uncharacterized membrane protein YphA (DoxX/SURF4 family)
MLAFLDVLRHRYLTLLFRLHLGAILAVAGFVKMMEPEDLLDAIRAHGILPSFLEQALAWCLPSVEIGAACLLLLGFFQRIGAAVSLLLAFMFVIANSVAIHKGIEYGCGCFGDILRLEYSETITLDIAMSVMAVQILLHKGEFLSLDRLLQQRKALKTK